MTLFEDVTLTDSKEIQAAPEQVLRELPSVVDHESHRRWPPADHVFFRWLKGEPRQEGLGRTMAIR